MKKLIVILFFASLRQVAVAQEIVLPKPTGCYSVGTKALEMCDPSRTMLRSADVKRFMVQAFYPAQYHLEMHEYMPGTLENGLVQGTKVFSWAKMNADFVKSKQFPVIIFVPGRGGERQKYTILCEELASQGYVILALDQPYVANFVKFPAGEKIVLHWKDAWKLPRDRDYRYRYDDEVIAGAMKDISYLLDNLIESKIEELRNICDSKQVVLMGHSLGGNVAHILGFQDDRIKAVVDIDSKITERSIFGHVGVPQNFSSKPVLFIRGMMQYQEDVGDQLEKIANSTIWSPQVEHSAFSDDAFFAAKIKNFGQQGFLSDFLNWFFKRGPYWDGIGTNLGGKEVVAWFVEYRSYVVQWLKEVVSVSN